MCCDWEESLGGWLLRRAPECQVYVSRLRRTPRGVAASASPRVPSYVSKLRRTHRGWLLRRAPEFQVYVSRLQRMPRGVAASASPRVPNLCVAIAKNASGDG